ncbi:MAG TPA: AraC family transcriptional regulator [Nocardioidaceae bacterium]|nr:AraC family transcriptional regulator [Nocardioidaceae bacterium]
MEDRLERYVAEDLLAPTSRLTVKLQHVHNVDVHWHDFYELAYVVEGHAEHRVNGVPHELSAGSAFLMTPADFHELHTLGHQPLSYYNVVIDPSLLESRAEALFASGLPRSLCAVRDMAGLQDDFGRLWHEFQRDRPGAVPMRQALLECILVEFGRGCATQTFEEPSPTTGDQAAIKRAVLFVDHHFREPLTLAGVAAQAHLSPNYFSERFREFTGTPFQAYLQQRRLSFARSLLASTHLGVTEVCHAAGFNTLSHFGRAYRSRYGESPSGYRNSTGGGPQARSAAS